MEVEPEPHQPPLARSEERLLPRRRVLEQLLALDDGAEGARRLGEEGVRDLRPDRADAADERGVRLAEAVDRDRAQRRASEEREPRAPPQHCFRLRANAAARLADATEREDALEPRSGPLPERDLGQDVEPEHEPELDLGCDQRRELEQARVGHGLR